MTSSFKQLSLTFSTKNSYVTHSDVCQLPCPFNPPRFDCPINICRGSRILKLLIIQLSLFFLHSRQFPQQLVFEHRPCSSVTMTDSQLSTKRVLQKMGSSASSFNFPVFSRFLNVTQSLLMSSSSSTRHTYLSFNNMFYNAVRRQDVSNPVNLLSFLQ